MHTHSGKHKMNPITFLEINNEFACQLSRLIVKTTHLPLYKLS